MVGTRRWTLGRGVAVALVGLVGSALQASGELDAGVGAPTAFLQPHAGLSFGSRLQALRRPQAGGALCRQKIGALSLASSLKPRSSPKIKGDWGKIKELGSSQGSGLRRPRLPRLKDDEVGKLARGQVVLKQARTGRIGQGLAVLDVPAPVSLLFAVLTDLDRYAARIGTVRSSVVRMRGETRCKASFRLSRFRLPVEAEFAVNRGRNMLEFRLDPDQTNPCFDEARGFWFVEQCPERPPNWSRVWLSASVTCSPLLPTFIVDYSASKALNRATNWIQPVMKSLTSKLPDGAEDVHEAVFLKPEEKEDVKGGDSEADLLKYPQWDPSSLTSQPR